MIFAPLVFMLMFRPAGCDACHARGLIRKGSPAEPGVVQFFECRACRGRGRVPRAWDWGRGPS